MKKSKMDAQGYYHEMQNRLFVSTNATGKNTT